MATPTNDKHHRIFDDIGHQMPPHDELVKEIRTWLDRYFGAVEK